MVFNKTIYVSANGNDGNSGLSSETPLQSIDAVIRDGIDDNTRILIEGGFTYSGCIRIQDKTNIFIGSYGAEFAIISSEGSTAIDIINCRRIAVAGLVLEGTGYRVFNQSSGLECKGSSDIAIDAVEARKYHKAGIAVKGSRNVEVTGCYVHDNGAVGICTGDYEGSYCENIRIAHCRAYDNAGDLSPKARFNHSGSGIIIAATTHAAVEFCDAAGNGWAQRQRMVNGPVGIWCCCGCDDVVFRYNIGRLNRTQPGAVDGDGFDIDGEVKNSVMEYNYSYGNEGSGYLLCEFYGDCTDILWDNNIARYNVSFADAARVGGYGAVNISSPADIEFERLYVKDNLFVAGKGLHCVYNKNISSSAKDMNITDNILITDGAKPIEADGQSNTRICDNIEILDKDLHRDMERKAPFLVNPRSLVKQPVYGLLTGKKCYEAIIDRGVEALFDVKKAAEFKYACKMMELQMFGPDFFGMDSAGDVSLYYDSLYPGVVTKMKAAGSRFWAPVPWWDNGKRYVFTAKARITSVDDRACMFLMDENDNIYRRAYFNHSVDEYFTVSMEFTGNEKWFDPGKFIGIEYESGSGSLLVHDIAFYELLKDDGTIYEKFEDSFRTFGDVFYDGGYEMYGCSAIVKSISEPVKEVVFEVESNCPELTAYIKGATAQSVKLDSGINHVNIPAEESVDLIIKQPYGGYTTYIKNIEGIYK